MSEHHDVNYKKIYFTLLFLLVISIIGPEFGILWVTLVTAFGIAFVKAYLVIENFMHLRWEKRLMKWALGASVAVMALMFFGIAPDVMKHEGRNWVNEAAIASVERGVAGYDDGITEGPTEMAGVEEPGVFSAAVAYNQACAACHGQAGDGAGPAGAVMDPAPADFTDPAFWAERDTDRIFTVIRDGAAAVGGSPLMVPWRNTYDDEQIQQLTEYVLEFRPQD
ncbi:MAG: c-type cytochrome [Gemmatimonadota bacterium]